MYIIYRSVEQIFSKRLPPPIRVSGKLFFIDTQPVMVLKCMRVSPSLLERNLSHTVDYTSAKAKPRHIISFTLTLWRALAGYVCSGATRCILLAPRRGKIFSSGGLREILKHGMRNAHSQCYGAHPLMVFGLSARQIPSILSSHFTP